MIFPFGLRIAAYLAMFGAMLLLEKHIPYVESEQRKSFRVAFHLGMSIANSLVLYLVMTRPLFAVLSYAGNRNVGLSHLFGLKGGIEILFTVMIFDLWAYWMHLANHKVGFLWRFHKAHHSDMEIDVTTAARFHIGELILSGIPKCLMILLWGPSLWGLVLFDVVLNLASQFHHSNLGLPLKIQDRLEILIVTPRMHRCHHSLHADCFNTNFSGIMSFWDRVFKSYHWARKKPELAPVGLFRPRGPATMKLKSFLLTPFREG